MSHSLQHIDLLWFCSKRLDDNMLNTSKFENIKYCLFLSLWSLLQSPLLIEFRPGKIQIVSRKNFWNQNLFSSYFVNDNNYDDDDKRYIRICLIEKKCLSSKNVQWKLLFCKYFQIKFYLKYFLKNADDRFNYWEQRDVLFCELVLKSNWNNEN